MLIVNKLAKVSLPLLPNAAEWFVKRFGKLAPTLNFLPGDTHFSNPDHVQREAKLQLKIAKRGEKMICVDLVRLETQSKRKIDLNRYIDFQSFANLKLKANEVKFEDCVFKCASPLGNYLSMCEIRVKITDTNKNNYYSEWISYRDFGNSLSQKRQKPLRLC